MAHFAQDLVESSWRRHPHRIRYVHLWFIWKVVFPHEPGAVPVKLVSVQVADIAVVDIDPMLSVLVGVLAGGLGVDVGIHGLGSATWPRLLAIHVQVCSTPPCQALLAAGLWVSNAVTPEVQTVRQ